MFGELLKKRRSIRAYTDEKIEDEKINKILNAALTAPSGRGVNPWEFVVLRDKESKKIANGAKKLRSDFLTAADTVVLVLVDKEKSPNTFVEDSAIVATIMQLQATELGIGSCWVHIRSASTTDGKNSSEYLKEKFNIPDRFVVDMLMSFGYPAEEKEEKTAASTDKIHYEKY